MYKYKVLDAVTNYMEQIPSGEANSASQRNFLPFMEPEGS
jgi:hypothetical protein